jgi:putative nucleotidyltransferase with HDIG domain
LQIISVDEVSFNKILPFNLYNENKELIFNAGEILTPGKLLQLRYMNIIYRETFEEEINEDSNESGYSETETLKLPAVTTNILAKSTTSPIISAKEQELILNSYKSILISPKENAKKNVQLCIELRDKIINEILSSIDDFIYRSQTKIHGDFNFTHGINVAALSIVLAHKLKLNEIQIKEIALGAMLHDIGKSRLPIPSELDKTNQVKDLKIMQLHSQVGYKIIREEMELPETIAKIALEHHEKNDGSGYPYCISGELIGLSTQIVTVCNEYDSLTSNRGQIKIKNSKEAIKTMLEEGSRSFNPQVLYTFVHMANYNDIEEYDI